MFEAKLLKVLPEVNQPYTSHIKVKPSNHCLTSAHAETIYLTYTIKSMNITFI